MKYKLIYFILLLILIGCSIEKEVCADYQLLYISKASGNFDIYLNDLNGTEIQLTTNPSWDWSPTWNQKCNSFHYNSYVDDTFKIQRMNLNGEKLTFNTYDLDEYNLSPNGKLIVTQKSVDDFSKLVISDFDDKNKLDITSANSYNGRAKWSYDSKKILYITDRDGNNEIYLYDLDSKSTSRLTNNNTNEKYLTWAPDGKRIAFTTEYYAEGKPDRNDVFILDLDTKEITQITNNTYEDSEIAWSPKGDKIAFHSKRDSVDHIYTMNLDGSNVLQISSKNTYHGEPEWVVSKVRCGE